MTITTTTDDCPRHWCALVDGVCPICAKTGREEAIAAGEEIGAAIRRFMSNCDRAGLGKHGYTSAMSEAAGAFERTEERLDYWYPRQDGAS